jgi:hypothetical protein
MWEYRLIWIAAPPPWWDDTWTAAVSALQRQSREPEPRPDTYLVLDDRPDVGLKLRGTDGEFEIKVRHDARDGWELWEKTPVFGWDALEAARFAALMQREFPPGPIDAHANAVDGVKTLLTSAGVSWREVVLDKSRMQGRADDLVPGLSSRGIEPAWLAEIVEIKTGALTAHSICFETMAPEAAIGGLPGAGAARNIGYPEFLIDAT